VVNHNNKRSQEIREREGREEREKREKRQERERREKREREERREERREREKRKKKRKCGPNYHLENMSSHLRKGSKPPPLATIRIFLLSLCLLFMKLARRSFPFPFSLFPFPFPLPFSLFPFFLLDPSLPSVSGHCGGSSTRRAVRKDQKNCGRVLQGEWGGPETAKEAGGACKRV